MCMWNNKEELNKEELEELEVREVKKVKEVGKVKEGKTAEPEAESLGSDKAMVIYHFVFRTYKGKSVLVDKFALRFLYNSFREISISKGFRIIKCHILSDHVHLLMEFEKRHRVDYAIRMIKGISSRRFFKYFDTNRYKYRKLWGRSYFAERIKQNNIYAISKYIEQQSINGLDKRFNQ